MSYICNMQYDTGSAECHINISALMQEAFKFKSPAHPYSHLILAPSG